MKQTESPAIRAIQEIKKAVIGKDDCIIKAMTAILAGGHILIEDVPGVGKTTLALAFSKALHRFHALFDIFVPIKIDQRINQLLICNAKKHFCHVFFRQKCFLLLSLFVRLQ